MIDAVEQIKTRARLLHRSVSQGRSDALQRVYRLPEFRKQRPDPEGIQRKHCLATLSRELGFSGWPHARRVLEGDPQEADFGTLWYPRDCGAFTNHWFAHYDEARESRLVTKGFLLAYKRQFFVVTPLYIETVGLDPHDPDWVALGWDWVRPRQRAARQRLYARLIAARPREVA